MPAPPANRSVEWRPEPQSDTDVATHLDNAVRGQLEGSTGEFRVPGHDEEEALAPHRHATLLFFRLNLLAAQIIGNAIDFYGEAEPLGIPQQPGNGNIFFETNIGIHTPEAWHDRDNRDSLALRYRGDASGSDRNNDGVLVQYTIEAQVT